MNDFFEAYSGGKSSSLDTLKTNDLATVEDVKARMNGIVGNAGTEQSIPYFGKTGVSNVKPSPFNVG